MFVRRGEAQCSWYQINKGKRCITACSVMCRLCTSGGRVVTLYFISILLFCLVPVAVRTYLCVCVFVCLHQWVGKGSYHRDSLYLSLPTTYIRMYVLIPLP